MAKRRRSAQTNQALLALQEQVNLVHWWESDVGWDYGRSFKDFQRKSGAAQHDNDVADLENYKLDRARTYYVTDEMQTLMEHAAHSMPEQPLHVEDLPSPFGFVWFENVIETLDVHGRPVSWRAMAWMPAATVFVAGTDIQQTGVHMSFYTDVLDHADKEFEAHDEREWMTWLNNGHPRLMLLHENGWLFGTDWRVRDAEDDIDAELDAETKERILSENEFYSRRYVTAVWAIMGQKIASMAPQHIPKTMQKPLYNRPVPAEVVYVDLRKVIRPKRHDGEDEERDVVWNHRWIVSGFWRNQYLPSTGTHRLQWIHDFVKGPADKPLVVKDRIYRVRR